MKITFISTNDTVGGAAIVTLRLMEALRGLGEDARMVVARKKSDNEWVSEVSRRRWQLAFLTERAEIFFRSGFNRRDIWKVDTGRYGCGVTEHPWVAEADVVVLAWVNQGMVSLDDVARLHRMGKKIVWTMHDMWCATGICHHSCDCLRYTTMCGRCPYLGSNSGATDLSTQVQLAKERLYGEVPIQFVAVSRWLGEICRESSLLKEQNVAVVPNAMPVERYSPRPAMSREEAGLPAAGALIVLAAARLDDPIKDLPLAIEALNRLNDMPLPQRSVAVLCGALKDEHALEGLRLPYVYLGSIDDPERMAAIFGHAAVVLSSSVRETLPGTLIEGMAAGAVPVTTGHGGQRDIVEHGIDGYILPPDTPADEAAEELAQLMRRAIEHPFDREAQHAAAARRFAASAVARRFLAAIGE